MRLRSVAAALLLLLASSARAQIASATLDIRGSGLTVETPDVTTAIDVPAAIQTAFGGRTGDAVTGLDDYKAVGDLVGAALQAPITLTTAPGHKFQIPGLPKGEYYFQNIRLMRGETLLQYAAPAVAHITVADILQTTVSVKQLTPEELRQRGILVDGSNYDTYEYTFSFTVGTQVVTVPFPVIVDRTTREAFPARTETPYILPPVSGPDAPRWTPPQIVAVEFAEEVSAPPTQNGLDDDAARQPIRVPAAIVIPNALSVLHQHFAVMLMVTNAAAAGSDVRIDDVKATIEVNDQLRVVKSIPAVAFGQAVPILDTKAQLTVLGAQAQGEAQWVLEGLKPGTHRLDFDLRATLRRPGQPDVALKATPTAAVVVHDPRFNITFSHPDTIRAGIEYSTVTFITNLSGAAQTLRLNTGIPPVRVHLQVRTCVSCKRPRKK